MATFLYGQAIPGCTQITGNFYSHPGLPGLLLVKVANAEALSRCQGIATELGYQSAVPSIVGTGAYGVHATLGRDRQFSDPTTSGAVYSAGPDSASEGPHVAAGVVSWKEKHVDGVLRGAQLSSLVLHPVTGRMVLDAGSNSCHPIGNTKIMGIVSDAEFGFISDASTRCAFYASGGSGTYSAADQASIAAAAGVARGDGKCVVGYAARNISLGYIKDILTRDKATIFDVPSEYSSERDAAVAARCATLTEQDQIIVPLGWVWYSDFTREFGIIGLRNVSGLNSDSGHITTTETGTGTLTSIVHVVPGGGAAWAPTDASPGVNQSVTCFVVEATPLMRDIAGRICLRDNVTTNDLVSPLESTVTWTGGATLSVALGDYFGHENNTDGQVGTQVGLTIGNVVGSTMPTMVTGQSFGVRAALFNSRLGGTMAKFATIIDEIFDDIKARAEASA